MQENTSLYAGYTMNQLAKQTIFQDNSYARFIATAHFPQFDFNEK